MIGCAAPPSDRWDRSGGVSSPHSDRVPDGIVDAEPVVPGDQGCADDVSHGAGDYVIFELPPGYRPPQREVHATLSNYRLGRVNVSPNGWVHFEAPTNFEDARAWIVLDGISFRCAPSGSTGCA